jgi:hypothetical protein
MWLSFNGVNTASLGIVAECRRVPLIPEPKIVTEEIPGWDGFYDLSAFNADGKVKYKPRIWEYRLGFEDRRLMSFARRAEVIGRLFASYTGTLVVDMFPEYEWEDAIVINQIDIVNLARTFLEVPVVFQTQAWWKGHPAE